jgi:hypothetical protein
MISPIAHNQILGFSTDSPDEFIGRGALCKVSMEASQTIPRPEWSFLTYTLSPATSTVCGLEIVPSAMPLDDYFDPAEYTVEDPALVRTGHDITFNGCGIGESLITVDIYRTRETAFNDMTLLNDCVATG